MASQNTMFKAVSAAVLAVIGVVILLLLLTGLNNGFISSGGLFGGIGARASAQSVILFIIKLLTGVFILSIIAGIGYWAYQLLVKNETLQTECKAPGVDQAISEVAQCAANAEEKVQEITHETCAQCGKELQNEWKLCPYCGQT